MKSTKRHLHSSDFREFRWTTEPVICFTADQDWAPDWATSLLCQILAQAHLPLHIFQTNYSDAVTDARTNSNLTIGWHPNFLPNSTQGSDIDSVIEYMKEIAPEARTVRCHSFYEHTSIWQPLADAGIVADSHCLTDWQDNLSPMRMWSGLYRFPLFYEDDIHFTLSPDVLETERLKAKLDKPGLKILNFHPIHVALNTPSLAAYDQYKASAPGPEDEQTFLGRGVRSVLLEIIEHVVGKGLRVLSFENLVDMTIGEGVNEK